MQGGQLGVMVGLGSGWEGCHHGGEAAYVQRSLRT